MVPDPSDQVRGKRQAFGFVDRVVDRVRLDHQQADVVPERPHVVEEIDEAQGVGSVLHAASSRSPVEPGSIEPRVDQRS